MDLKQGDTVIGQVYDLSAQQLIILLSIYIGCPKQVSKLECMPSWVEDMSIIQEMGLVKWDLNPLEPKLTDTAHKYINNILTITVMKEVKETIKIEPKKD